MISETMKRETINSSLVTLKQSDPPLTSLVPGKEGMFMLALNVQSIDLSFQANLAEGPQYFSFQMAII
jgi:hypothetical protein